MKYVLFIITMLVLFACSESENKNDDLIPDINESAEIESIKSKVKQFSEHVMNGDFRAVGEMYTEDAKIFPNNLDIIHGRDSVIGYWNTPSDFSISHHKIMPEEIKIWGDEAYDYGYYEGRSTDSLGGEFPWKGKYVIIWKKVNADWKIHLDIWNRIQEDV